MSEQPVNVPDHLAELCWRYATDMGAGTGKYRWSDLRDWEKRRFQLAAKNVLDRAAQDHFQRLIDDGLLERDGKSFTLTTAAELIGFPE